MARSSAKHHVHQMMKKHHQSEMKLVPVHISKEEIIGFNILQATEENPDGQWVDPKTGLREYSRLSPILKQPHIRDEFIQLAQGLKDPQSLAPEISEQMQTPLPDEMFIPIPSDEDPEVQQMEGERTIDDDKFIVMLPVDVVHFLSFLQGGSHDEPFEGLPQFGVFDTIKSIVRVGATVVGTAIGFTMGGPLGAAAGAYLGNAAGRAVTGQPLFGSNNVWKAATPNAIYGGAAGMGMSAAGMGASAATAAPIVNGHTGAVMAANTASVAPAAITPTATAAAPSLLSSMGSQAMQYLPQIGLLGGGYMLARKGDKQREKEYQDYRNQQESNYQNIQSHYNNNADFKGSVLAHPTPKFNPNYGRAYDDDYKGLGDFAKEWEQNDYRKRRYKKGGLVVDMKIEGTPLKGKGDGQSDSINKKIKEYTWIHDAHTVSALGNGDTEAGHKEIKAFERYIKKELLPHYKDTLKQQIKAMPKGRLRPVACAVATGEREMPPLLVGALGEGSFEKGGDKLRHMTKIIRRHKTSKPTELPPASLGLMTYYKKAMGGK